MNLFKFIFTFLVCGFFPLASRAQNPTFSENVAAILYQNCSPCHRQGGVAPFKIESYNEAVQNGMAIKNAVSTGYMPPWPPDTTYTRFVYERVINKNQIQQIIDWVDNGMPQGNPANEPPLPLVNNNSQLSSTPDGVFTIPTYTVDTNQDVYRAFVIPSQLVQTRAITEIEFKPANKRIVHHILLFYDTTGLCQTLDNADPLPGFAASGGIGNANAKQLGAWVPGSPALKLPSGFGIPAYANGKFVIQIHYAPGSLGEKDSTRFELIYKNITPQMREVFQLPILNHFTNLINGPIYLPPNQTKLYVESFNIPIPISVIAVAPHMHLIGRNMKVFAKNPTQEDTSHIIRIKDWNFNWQGQYMYRKPLILPQGTLLRAEAFYDNTPENPFNPTNPPELIKAGESTLNEMMMVYFMFATYKPGDENLVLDSNTITQKTETRISSHEPWVLYPNPAENEIYISAGSLNARMESSQIEIFQGDGKLVQRINLDHNREFLGGAYRLSIQSLKPGVYHARIPGKAENIQFRFLKTASH